MTLNRETRIRLISPDGQTEYVTGSASGIGISQGSMNLNEMLCESELVFGSYCANKFEVELFGLTSDVTGYKIEVKDVFDENNPIALFTGIVDSSVRDAINESRKIVAYDQMYYTRDMNMASWWNTFWENHQYAPLSTVREMLVAAAGFTYAQTVLPNDNLTISKFTSFTSVKFSDLLRMICEVQCCFPNVRRDGTLEFLQLQSLAVSVSSFLDTRNSAFEDYQTALITGIAVYGSSSELSQLYGTATNAYISSGNIFLLNLSAASLNTALARMFNAISDLQYKPASIDLIYSQYGLHLGDKISTNVGVHYILSQVLSGSQLVNQAIESPAYGELLNSKPSVQNDRIIEGKKFSEITHDIDGLTIRVGDAEQGITTINHSLDGIIVDGGGGQTVVAGGRIRTSDLYLDRLYPSGDHAHFHAVMEEESLTFKMDPTSAQSGFIYIGYATAEAGSTTTMPYIKLGVDNSLTPSQGVFSGGALIKRYGNGIWIGDDWDLNSESPSTGSGLFINLEDYTIYKVVDGVQYELTDSQTRPVIAVFG